MIYVNMPIFMDLFNSFIRAGEKKKNLTLTPATFDSTKTQENVP